MNIDSKTILLTIVLGALARSVLAQEAVPFEIMQRTLLIRCANPKEFGTAFSLDYHGKLYLVTARHVAVGEPLKNAVIQVNVKGEWQNYQTVRTLYPASPKVDIAVFETYEKAPPNGYVIQPMGPGGVTFGQRLWFIGYPFGLHSIFKGGMSVPFMKQGSMSAIDASDPDAEVFYIDGFNNPGFSGGPIIYWNFSTHTYGLLGVVIGYRTESTTTPVNGKLVPTKILENSGILIAYPIQYAIDAIEASLKSGK